MLEVKASRGAIDGWQLIAEVQHDNTGQAVFYHRTMDKWQLGARPCPTDVITGPLPVRWCEYYVAHGSQGPTRGFKPSTCGAKYCIQYVAGEYLQCYQTTSHTCLIWGIPSQLQGHGVGRSLRLVETTTWNTHLRKYGHLLLTKGECSDSAWQH